MLQQEFDDGIVTITGGSKKRGSPVSVFNISLGALAQQKSNNFHMPPKASGMKGAPVVATPCLVGVNLVLLQKLLDSVKISLFGSLKQKQLIDWMFR
jgi:hypothetical protein